MIHFKKLFFQSSWKKKQFFIFWDRIHKFKKEIEQVIIIQWVKSKEKFTNFTKIV